LNEKGYYSCERFVIGLNGGLLTIDKIIEFSACKSNQKELLDLCVEVFGFY